MSNICPLKGDGLLRTLKSRRFKTVQEGHLATPEELIRIRRKLLHDKKYRADAKERLLKFQERRCAICLTHITDGRRVPLKLMLDHCHKTNKIRGLLCGLCNTGLGSFKDKIWVFERAIKYLKDPPTDNC